MKSHKSITWRDVLQQADELGLSVDSQRFLGQTGSAGTLFMLAMLARQRLAPFPHYEQRFEQRAQCKRMQRKGKRL